MRQLHRNLTILSGLLTMSTACSGPPDGAATEQVGDSLRAIPATTATEASFTLFESGQVRPLAMSPDGRHLYAVNTPDNRLEIFRVADGRIASVGSVTVGLEPVAVAARNDDEVWVVNHLSDSVSVVNVKKPKRAHVTRTLLVGDEPRDIVFAQDRAYVTTAHRGQNTGRNPQLTTPSVGRADVWVFNPSALGDTLAGVPVTVLSLFADTPRALAVSPDGTTVYAAAFRSGNRTTVVNERHVTNNGFAPPPSTNADGVPAPWGSLIVKYRESPLDGQLHWLDELNRPWDSIIRFSLPDKDVFAIDATLAVPAQKPGAGALAGVGTVLFNMAVNPVSGKVYVANLEALNDVRFEGHNAFGGGGSVRGHMAESRISVIDGADVTSRHLNKHIDFSQDGTPAEAEKSLAFPTGMDVSRDGKWLYVAALGSNKLGIFETSALESDEFVPSVDQQVALSGGGPTGVVLDEKNGVAYVMTRFDNGISVVNLKHRREVEHVKMYNPEPPSITNGRRFLYDATLTSSHGDSACASCHIFGDLDDLAWDLGNPDGSMLRNPGPFATPVIPPLMGSPDFHPMKGPTTTQSLRGMANHGPMHWRGDRTGGNDVPASAQPDTGTFDEQAAFKKFNQAFPGLLGRASELTDAEMQAFTDFILQVTYPPNPIRNLDNSLTPAQAAGRAFYFNSIGGQELPSDTFRNCNGCHTLDPNGNAAFGVARPGFFGSDGRSSFENEPQFMKIPHLRNLYQKVGMFGLADNFRLPIDNPAPRPPLVSFLPPPLNDPSFMGDQIRGFGFSHTGEVDTVFRFVGATVFAQRPETDPFPNPFGIPTSAQGIVLRRTLEAFLLAYDTNLAPIVGQQVTLTGDNHLVASARVDLLEQRAAAGDCELVVRARLGSCEVGFLYAPASGAFVRDRAGAAALSDDELRSLSSMAALTFTAVPRGSGARIALDRESDGVLDGDQNEDCDGF